MKYSQLFGKSQRSVSKDLQPVGNALLHQAGYVRESAAGRFYFLPLGMRVRDKVCRIIEDEMNRVGGQKFSSPILHPVELWHESGRSQSAAFELTQVTDRRGRGFVLGGTAEEMTADLVRKFDVSYRDLPMCLYQFSQKFRDELRTRGGLLRTREFLMKDGYSFHSTKADFERFYSLMSAAYLRTFERLGLTVRVVAADNGYMGGDYSHEYVVEHPAGESRFLISNDESLAVHEDIARFDREQKNLDEALLEIKVQAAIRGPTIGDGVLLYQQPAWRQIKSIVYQTDAGEFILVCLRGDLEINETKLCRAAGCHSLRMATEDEVTQLGSVIGFVSPLKLRLRKIGDYSLTTVRNFYTGADAFQLDTLNVNYDRDFVVDVLADVASAPEGAMLVGSDGPSRRRAGIEVGNIFQLGTHYSDKMVDLSYADNTGGRQPYYMGCYGIGVDRTVATIAEVHRDEKGLVWPAAVAPFEVHLVSLLSEQDRQPADILYEKMNQLGIEVLYDDRPVSAGVKLADVDLIGIPHRVVVSKRTVARGMVEYKLRGQPDAVHVTESELFERLT